LRLFVLLHITLFRAEQRVRSARSERGSVTVEHVLWAVAVIAIVAIVVAAVKAYVTSQSGKLK
jgi:heme/copper-type cytochrome/quinol oxidase subunit 2